MVSLIVINENQLKVTAVSIPVSFDIQRRGAVSCDYSRRWRTLRKKPRSAPVHRDPAMLCYSDQWPRYWILTMQLISQTEFNRMDFIEASRVRRPLHILLWWFFLFCFVSFSCFFSEDGHSRRVSIVVSTLDASSHHGTRSDPKSAITTNCQVVTVCATRRMKKSKEDMN